ncbi:NAD-binding protein [Phellopilus nigrolimitatus]|nr:NAD-binding protein [Phellopilus nigrolimitatus]
MSTNSTRLFNYNKLTDLTGKIALVTGGGTGIGLMMAKGFAANGAKVYITGRRLNVLQEAAKLIFEGKGMLIPLQMDVTNKASILAVVEKIKGADGKLDILVNNAGTNGPKTSKDDAPSQESQTLGEYGRMLFDSQDFDQWDTLAQTNVASLFFVTMAFLGLLEAGRGGAGDETASVINFAYASLKAATSHLTQLLSTEFALRHAPILVNGIAPGLFPSELNTKREKLDEFAKTPMATLQPIPARREGKDEEMAALAVYLASPASEYTRGQEIIIDGGLEMVNP